MEDFLQRPVTIEDIHFLAIPLDDMSIKQQGVFIGIQLAYQEKYIRVLRDPKYAFTPEQKASFAKEIDTLIDGTVSLHVFLQTLYTRRTHIA